MFNEAQKEVDLESITFGLTDGWWCFADVEARASFPLLRRLEWKIFFMKLGFLSALHVLKGGSSEA